MATVYEYINTSLTSISKHCVHYRDIIAYEAQYKHMHTCVQSCLQIICDMIMIVSDVIEIRWNADWTCHKREPSQVCGSHAFCGKPLHVVTMDGGAMITNV